MAAKTSPTSDNLEYKDPFAWVPWTIGISLCVLQAVFLALAVILN